MGLVPLGLWVAIIGYGIAYAGVQKLAGDSHYTLRQAFRGEPPKVATAGAQAAGAGTTLLQAGQDARAAQASVIGEAPLSA